MILDGKTEWDETQRHLISLIDEVANELKSVNTINEFKAGFNPNQRRGKGGKWSKTGWHNVDIKEQMEAHNEFGGSSFDLDGENLIGKENAFSVGIFVDKSLRLDNGEPLTAKLLSDYYDKHKDILTSSEDLIIGTWIDKGIHYADITRIVIGLEEAKELKKLGVANNQIKIFDLENLIEIPTGGTGK